MAMIVFIGSVPSDSRVAINPVDTVSLLIVNHWSLTPANAAARRKALTNALRSREGLMLEDFKILATIISLSVEADCISVSS